MPVLFDEQARHLGIMGQACAAPADLAAALRRGGNVALVGGLPVCLGMTAKRLALNAELFEKCAKAYVLARGGGRADPRAGVVGAGDRRTTTDQGRAARRPALRARPAAGRQRPLLGGTMRAVRAFRPLRRRRRAGGRLDRPADARRAAGGAGRTRRAQGDLARRRRRRGDGRNHRHRRRRGARRRAAGDDAHAAGRRSSRR